MKKILILSTFALGSMLHLPLLAMVEPDREAVPSRYVGRSLAEKVAALSEDDKKIIHDKASPFRMISYVTGQLESEEFNGIQKKIAEEKKKYQETFYQACVDGSARGAEKLTAVLRAAAPVFESALAFKDEAIKLLESDWKSPVLRLRLFCEMTTRLTANPNFWEAHDDAAGFLPYTPPLFAGKIKRLATLADIAWHATFEEADDAAGGAGDGGGAGGGGGAGDGGEGGAGGGSGDAAAADA